MLINGVACQDGQGLSDIPIEDIDEWGRKPGCFVWVALHDTTDDELRQMQRESGLHELTVEHARQGHQRPKIEQYGDTLFVVMKLPEARQDLSMVTIEESETSRRLAVWAAIFAVSTALAGIWGMNFEHMPEPRWAWGHPMALAANAGAAGILSWRFQRAGCLQR
ncbi:MAG: hypothetical protein HYZ20_11110 [Burkholderiales bacterium]|nr:hypothetical protein [Burkholderiales bacterium]